MKLNKSLIVGSVCIAATTLIAEQSHTTEQIDAETPQTISSVRSDADWRLSAVDRAIERHADHALDEGRQTFRYDTFGDEAFWGDTLKLHQALEGSRFGGVGDGVSPATALSVGLKVDVDALPRTLIDNLKRGKVDLNDPATTLALLKLNAVVGVTGFFNSNGSLRSVGIQCALSHQCR